MNILVAVEELRFGGAQTFALRLAQALREAGHGVWLYTMYGNLTETELVRRLAPDVPVLAYEPSSTGLDAFAQRADGWLERHGQHRSLRRRALRAHLSRMLRQHRIDVVSSNTFKSDELMAEVLAAGFPKVPLVVTMHGDYEQFWAFYQAAGAYALPEYPARLARTLARVTGMAYLADQNLRVLEPAVVPLAHTAHIQRQRIYNGMEGRFSADAGMYTRAALGIEPEAFVVGMVARGVAEKGWEPLLQAFDLLSNDPALARWPVHVVIVGSSPFIEELRARYATNSRAHFLGFVNNPVDVVPTLDVGVLASSLKESLPNSIAEYLFAGRPVVSTDIGEIGNMLRPELNLGHPAADEPTESAGFLIDFPPAGQQADPQQLYAALRRYATDADLLQRHQELALLAFRKFSMSRCVAAYEALYETSQKALIG
ncbi:MAG: hypothetical protein JWP58_3545 [Hymenobacter sp.]|nr:hypothetical protein [Hymenobacter sp.]